MKELELDQIYNLDCLDGMKHIPDGSIDLVVTSPPYDNLRSYNGTADDWNFDKFKALADELARTLKEGGVIVWNVNDATVDGSKTGTSFRQCLYFMEKGLKLNDTMIWRKTNPMPQVRQPRYAACFEFMFILSKGKPKSFNPIMRKNKCGGQEYNSTCKNMGGENGRTKKELIINTEAVDYNIWDIAVAQECTWHPAVFPFDIPLRHVHSWSNPGDTVLDPFMGSGTTAVACIKEKRHFIGFELNKDYYDKACRRIDAERRQLSLF